VSQVKLPYVEQGDATGVPVVMLHGGTDSWRSFEPVLPYLPDDIRAIAVTQRGHGDAPKPDSGYLIEDLAGDVGALMDELELSGAIVVGHSMGSMVAQRIAIDHTERVRGVVLAGVFGHPQADSPALAELADGFGSIEDPIAREVAHEFQVSTTATPLEPEQLNTFVDESLKVPARVWREAFNGFPRVDYSAELSGLNIPALIVYGDQDELISRTEQDALLDALPDARFEVYEGVGHAMHWEQPERFAQDIVEFSRYCAGLPLSR
jgi:non-heme chloroperoxidase